MIKLTLTQGITTGYFWPIVDGSGSAVNLTGWTAKCQIRSDDDHNATLLAELDCTVGEGGVSVSWSVEDSLDWTFKNGFFDVILIDPDGVARQIVVEGMVVVNRVVTSV